MWPVSRQLGQITNDDLELLSYVRLQTAPSDPDLKESTKTQRQPAAVDVQTRTGSQGGYYSPEQNDIIGYYPRSRHHNRPGLDVCVTKRGRDHGLSP